MARPAGMILTRITFGTAATIVSGTPLTMRVTFSPTTDLVWADTGDVFVGLDETVTATTTGMGQVWLPNPDQNGFVDGAGNTIRNFAYKVTAEYTSGSTAVTRNQKYITWTADDAGPIDLDLMIPVTTSAAVSVYIPDSWSAQVAAATAAAVSAAASLNAINSGGITDGSGGTLTVDGKTWYAKTQADLLLAAKAALDSPALTGLPTAPTAGPGTVSTQLATTEFVAAQSAADLTAAATAGIGYDSTQFGAPQHEDQAAYTYPTRLTFGALTPPPLAKTVPDKGVDLIAHWYNDFGLEYEASSSTQANGSYTWYDWSWNFPTNPTSTNPTWTYDPARHPLLGNYKGDDPVVLDWICYWLAESGVNVVSIVDPDGYDSTGWSTPANHRYWQYQLFTNTPNFKLLKFVAWAATQTAWTLTQYEAQSTNLAALYGVQPNPYTIVEDGKTYAGVFLWDIELVRGALDSYVGAANTRTWLIDLATKMRAQGFDGVAVLARHFNSLVYTDGFRADVLSNGVLLLAGEYEERYNTDSGYSNSYSTYATTAAFPTTAYSVPNVVTAAKTQAPHPSTWSLAGTAPALFGKLLQRAVASIVKNNQRRILTVYNISEWAEGGPGLIPQQRDAFGYLDQIKALPPVRLRLPSTTAQAAAAVTAAVTVSARHRGAVVLHLDDAYASQYSVAAPLAEQYGGRLTYAIPSTFTNFTGHLYNADILDLFNRGHEIAAHSKTHPDMTTLTATQRIPEWDDGKTYLEGIVGAGQVTTFVFPPAPGVTNLTMNVESRLRYDRTFSGMLVPYVRTRDESRYGIEKGRYNWYGTPAHAGALALVRRAAAEDVIVTIVTHAVDGSDTTYGVTTAQFTELVALANTLGVPLVTARDAFPAYTPIPDPGFEDSTLASWSPSNINATNTIASVADTPMTGLNGARSLRVVGDGTTFPGALSQPIPVTAGNPVTFSARIRQNKTSGTGGGYVALKEYDTSGTQIGSDTASAFLTATGTTAWQQVTVSLTPTASTRTIVACCVQATMIGSTWFDHLDYGPTRYGVLG